MKAIRPGLMFAIAFESVLKLVALLLLALVCFFWLFKTPVADTTTAPMARFFASFDPKQFDFSFATQLLLAASATLCLPRQFHVTFIENTSHHHLRRARYLYPIYLLLISCAVLPIAVVGTELFSGLDTAADTYVLAIPLEFGGAFLPILIFFGGFAAATGMIVVSTLSLSTMITNDIILPYALKKRGAGQSTFYYGQLIFWRRASIATILLLAYLYKIIIGDYFALAATGLVAFSLVAQLLPPLIGGLFWSRGTARGTMTGLIAGVAIWFYFIMLPQLATAGIINPAFLQQGPWEIAWLNPADFLGLGSDNFNTGVWLSLLLNAGLYVIVSTLHKPTLQERTQADNFTNPLQIKNKSSALARELQVSGHDLFQLLRRFLGKKETQLLLQEFNKKNKIPADLEAPPNPELIEFSEKRLAGAVGSSTASALITSIIAGQSLAPETLVNIFDQTSQQLQFNQQLLQTTLENISQGISVVDHELNLVAWNQRYLEMFDYPDGFIYPGIPVATVMRFNGERGDFGSGSLEHQINKRLNHIRRGTSYVYQRQRQNGRVYEIRGKGIPNGGFVTTYTDITDFKEVETELQQAKDKLEERVIERTRQIQKINEELQQEVERRLLSEQAMEMAKQEAERAYQTKTQFIGQASHDVLQPLTAARLYTGALQEMQLTDGTMELVDKVNRSLRATEGLISTLLELARFDQGAIQPSLSEFAIQPMLDSLIEEFNVIADEKGFEIRSQMCSAWVRSDPKWLRRILQNFISNAIKYSNGPKILVGCLRSRGALKVLVADSGPGIAQHEQAAIFEEFYRRNKDQKKATGAGLGLAVVKRMGLALQHQVGVFSDHNKGSIFYVELPIVAAMQSEVQDQQNPAGAVENHKNIWYVDNDRSQLDAMHSLLSKWNMTVTTADTCEQALDMAQQACPDVLLMDYDLNDSTNGINLFIQMKQHWPQAPQAVLVTASQDRNLKEEAKAAGMGYLAKPIKPAALRALLMH
ncbi:PAS-domain containing protein [Marinicella sp. W31]|uniref:PAS-domain containing protein n=1 Tax=Marinicella sp. W31 TaxID=3023713 RepID=UPI0037573DC1